MLLGVDVGGTFTDAVLVDGERIRTAKVPTTPEDQSVGVIAAVEEVLAGTAAGDVEVFAHGMTVGTNALLEERGAAHRADRDPGLRRPARDRPPGPPRALPALRAEAEAAGRARDALRGGRAGRARGHRRGAARRGAAAPCRSGPRERSRVGRRLPPLLLPRPLPRAADRRAPAARAPRGPRLRLARGPAPHAGVRALLDDRDRRLPLPPPRPLPRVPRRGGGGRGAAAPGRDAVLGRRRRRIRRRAGGRLERPLGAGRRRGRRRPDRPRRR